jgi:UDP-N-acetylmuramate--alanine ligase
MLSQIARLKKSIVISGSHGKTTVTSICAVILESAGLDPTVVNGGVINSYKTNAKLGSGDWAVIESDESDGSFLKFFPTIGVITNIDKEHIGHYGSFENLKLAFKTFLKNLPFYGAGIACVDNENVKEIVNTITDRKIITYSINNESMYRAENIKKSQKGAIFDIQCPDCKVTNVETSLLGDHNILNSLAAFAVANELNIDHSIVKAALLSFGGVERRFSILGKIKEALIIDDYAHHPTEIKSVLQSTRQRSSGKLMVICQPHRFTRLASLFNEFCNCFDIADIIVLTPVYKADELEDGKVKSEDLYKALLEKGKDTMFVNNEEEIKALIEKSSFSQGDIILFVGAGNISKWAHNIWKSLS